MHDARRGSALILALVISVIAIGIAGAFLADTIFRTQSQFHSVQSDEAQMICDAALEKTRRALWVYQTTGQYPWDAILLEHSALSLDPDVHVREFAEHWDDPVFVSYRAGYNSEGINTRSEAPGRLDPDHFLGRPAPFGGGGFHCVIRDNDDGDGDPLRDSDLQVLVYITGMLPGGAARQILALVRYDEFYFTPDAAILVDGPIRFNGSPDVEGEVGIAYSNGDIDITGSAKFSVAALATGRIASGHSQIPPGGFVESSAPMPLPEIDPEAFRTSSDYVLEATGNVRCQKTGAILGTGSALGWSFSGGLWSLSGTVAPAGTYFVEGNAMLTGGAQRLMSVIATGSIQSTGGTKFIPSLPNTLFIAGGDIKLSGTSGSYYLGLIASREQIRTIGNFELNGVMLSLNAANRDTLVSSASFDDDSQFGGSMKVRYDGGLATAIRNADSAVRVRNVRRLR